MRWWVITGYGLSVVAHIGFAAGIGSIRKDHPRPQPTIVKVFETKKAKSKEADKEKEKPPPPPPKKSLEPPPPPKNTPPPPTNTSPTPAGHEAMAALPDFGISLGGGADGAGIAVPIAGQSSAGPERAVAGGGGPAEKKVKGPAPKPTDAADACVEEATKPKSVDKVQPQYTDEARSANVEGVVKVEFRIDANGDVVDARVISGLGHGLDQAALAAAKRWKFNPATKCGKPVESRHVVSMRFQLGD
jgi:periplasmic protein TonB